MFGNDCNTRRDRWRMQTAVHGGCYTIALVGRRGGRLMLILVVKLRKSELRENITIKAIVFFPVTPPCCGTGLSLTFPDHQGESSGRQRGLLERQEGRICWRTRRWGVNVFEHHTMTCWQQLYLNPPCCHLRQTNQNFIGFIHSAFCQTGVFRLEKWSKLSFLNRL